ncbi:MAG: DUF1385 domain-containing protein [Abditibacteriaceae bacterium]
MNQKFQLGGQALIEGVMMRSPNFIGAAVRRKDGRIETRVDAFHSLGQRYSILAIPLIRGMVALVEMMMVGMRYLNWSGNLALEDEEPDAEKKVNSSMPWWALALTVVASLGFGLALFVVLPNLVVQYSVHHMTHNVILLNLTEGIVKLIIFLGYLYLIGRRSNIHRLFEYHGAEHKVVYAAENNCPLTPDGARPFDTPHPRCGTGFALLTVFVSVICFVFLPWTNSDLQRVAWRLLLMPLVAGISYEVIKLTVNPQLGGLAKIILTPGMWLQRLTTAQPDDEQLAVSCEAMKVVLAAEAEFKSKNSEAFSEPVV